MRRQIDMAAAVRVRLQWRGGGWRRATEDRGSEKSDFFFYGGDFFPFLGMRIFFLRELDIFLRLKVFLVFFPFLRTTIGRFQYGRELFFLFFKGGGRFIFTESDIYFPLYQDRVFLAFFLRRRKHLLFGKETNSRDVQSGPESEKIIGAI